MQSQTSKYKSLSQRFVEKYIEIARNNQDLEDEQIFKNTEESIKAEGFAFKREESVTEKREEKATQQTTRQKPLYKDTQQLSNIALSDE